MNAQATGRALSDFLGLVMKLSMHKVPDLEVSLAILNVVCILCFHSQCR